MLRAALTALFTCATLPAAALCGGDSYIARLSPATQADIARAVSETPNANGLVWTATKARTTLTIVGTVHVYDPRLEALRVRLKPSITQADLLLVEATAAEEAAMQDAFIADPDIYLINEGPTLPELLEPALWDKVTQAANDRGLPSFFVAKLQPWYLSLTLAIPACAMADVASGRRGLDHMLMADAQAANVPLQALEGWETLIDILTDGTQEEQIDLIRSGLIDAVEQQALFVAMLDSYFAENVAEVWEVNRVAASDLTPMSASEAEAQMAETQTMLLDTRNRNWIPVITDAAAVHDDIVIAVGAAHLPGQLGVLALLQADGWTLTRQSITP